MRPRRDWPETVHALGFSWRKRAILRSFLRTSQVRFISEPDALPEGAVVVVWASGPYGGQETGASWVRRVQRVRVEDGFLRSVGLGADLVRPLSWVFDWHGIHYDPSSSSDLEQMLQDSDFEAGMLDRAARLRERLVQEGLGKYNLGGQRWRRPPLASGRRVVLVPGQVETDAAFRAQVGGPKSNLELLQAARRDEPKSWLLYKPHPDVVAGLRSPGRDEAEVSRWCDEVVVDVDTADLLGSVDAVHVLSTLTGFEALLRGREVTCHGLPFYAGWGLTIDRCLSPRRNRSLSLDALVAAALVQYPHYVSARTGEPCAVEQVVDELLADRDRQRQSGFRAHRWRRWIRPVLRRP